MLFLYTILLVGAIAGHGINTQENTLDWFDTAPYLNKTTPYDESILEACLFPAATYDYRSCIRAKFIIKQNQYIIEQNNQILDNQKILKCYMLHTRSQVYVGDVYGGYYVTSNPAEIVKICGQ